MRQMRQSKTDNTARNRNPDYLTAIVIYSDPFSSDRIHGAKYHGIHQHKRRGFYGFIKKKFPTVQHINFYRPGSLLLFEQVKASDF